VKHGIAIIIPTMDRGGAEKQVCLLAAGLAKSEFQPHVILLTRGGPRTAQLDAAGIPWTLVGKRAKFDPTAYWRLKRLLRQLAPTVVHTFLFAANSYGRAAAGAVGVPVRIASERCVDPWKTWRHGVVDRHLAKQTTAITTNSTAIVDFYANRGIDPALFHVIPNGIGPYRPTEMSRQQVAENFGLHGERKWVGAVGRLWPQKRYRDLIWAGEMLNTLRQDDSTLVIVGDGPQRGELQRHRDAVSNPRRVRFVGNRTDVNDLLGHLDAFWLASDYEGQSNALMEAMRAGVACVVTDIPGNRDLIEHDKTGVLVRVADSADFVRQTQHLWTTPELKQQVCSAAAEKIARQFTIDQMVQQHLDLYRTCIERAT
jgi:glycosyltransferase involved in cell wall biosynthesis